MIRTLTSLRAQGWCVVLDSSQVIPADPGAGTPAMVYGPNKAAGTYWCVADTGEASCGPTVEQVPPHVARWLDSLADTVNAFVEEHGAPKLEVLRRAD